MLSLNCGICRGKKLRLIKEQKLNELLSILGTRESLNKVSVFGDILF